MASARLLEFKTLKSAVFKLSLTTPEICPKFLGTKPFKAREVVAALLSLAEFVLEFVALFSLKKFAFEFTFEFTLAPLCLFVLAFEFAFEFCALFYPLTLEFEFVALEFCAFAFVPCSPFISALSSLISSFKSVLCPAGLFVSSTMSPKATLAKAKIAKIFVFIVYPFVFVLNSLQDENLPTPTPLRKGGGIFEATTCKGRGIFAVITQSKNAETFF